MSKKDDRMKEFDEFDDMFEELEEMDTEDDEVYEMPAEWDASFRAIFDQKYEEHKRKRRNRVLKKLSVAAGVLLVIFAGTGLFAQKVEGNGIPELFEYVLNIGGRRHVVYNTDEEFDVSMGSEDNLVFYYEYQSIEEIQEAIRKDCKENIITVGKLPFSYKVEYATYDCVLDMINLELNVPNGKVFISQNKNYEEGGKNNISEKEVCASVDNDNIGKTIDIYKGLEENCFLFNVQLNYTLFSFIGDVTLEECKLIARELLYQ